MRRFADFDRKVDGAGLSGRSRGLNLASAADEVFDALEVEDRAPVCGLIVPPKRHYDHDISLYHVSLLVGFVRSRLLLQPLGDGNAIAERLNVLEFPVHSE